MWFRKKLNSNEYELLRKRFVEHSAELEELQIKFKVLKQDVDNLRGNFNRRVNRIKEDPEKSEELNNPVILPDNGNPFKRY